MMITEEAFDKMVDLNIKSTFFTLVECFDLLKAAPKANVCMMSSVAGRNPNPMLGHYGMTKAAMDAMVKYLAEELLDDKIRVNAIAPAVIKTKFAAPIWDNAGADQSTVGTPEQVSRLTCFICSDEGDWCNGETYYIHGGYSKI